MRRKVSQGFANDYLGEVISYGGVPMRRRDVHAVCLADTGSKGAADLFAFGPQTRVVKAEPVSVAGFRSLAEVA